MPIHTEYADGSPRPLFRGWLHGAGALTLVPQVVYFWDSLPAPATPGVLSICCIFILSSLVHLVPWKSARVLGMLSKMDKSSILANCGLSFMGPQLLKETLCKPDFLVSLWTVAIPVATAIAGVFCGLGPIVFLGCLSGFASIFWFYGTQIAEREVFYHVFVCMFLYGAGLYFYASQVGGHKKYWGYHEWMHLLVTIGMVINIRGLLIMSDYKDEQCRPDLFTDESSSLPSLDEKEDLNQDGRDANVRLFAFAVILYCCCSFFFSRVRIRIGYGQQGDKTICTKKIPVKNA